MTQYLTASLVSNAGLLLTYNGTKILLDAIFGGRANPFSDVPPAAWQKMLAGEPSFDGIDYLMFTHRHPDHFTPHLVETYLDQPVVRRGIRGVFFPQEPSDSIRRFTEYLEREGIPYRAIGTEKVSRDVFFGPALSFRAIPTKHLGPEFRDVSHVCYFFRAGDHTMLFTGDVDYTTETFEMLRGTPIGALFVNPLFFHELLRGEEGHFFHGHLDAKLICAYHIPFEGDDNMQIRGMVTRDLMENKGKEPRAVALSCPGEQIRL